MGPENTEEPLKGWTPMSCKGQVQQIKARLKNQSMFSEDQKKNLTQGKENSLVEASQAFTSKNPHQEVPKKAKQTSKTNQKGKQKPKWNKPHPQNYRIPKKEKTAMDNVFNMARTLMEFKNNEEEKLNKYFSKEVDLVNLVTLLNQPDDNFIAFITSQLKELRIQVQNLEKSTRNNADLFKEQLEKSDKARLESKEDIQSSINNISLKIDLPRQSTQILDRNVLNLNNDLHHTVSSNAEVETAWNFKDIQRLEEWPTFSGEGEYNHMEFMKKIDMFKEHFNLPDE
ncbi:hypothetical protein O181_056395 [Austropuccinia psidii MF-1]|uniref:Uncharacterized protein n=1 Tax=Austropuccinia psidii MF-1 TaxID=1389203 RepID=A0A9Q3ECL1_9BASI|nr:hypothetical protein [Austropuccinia psidii MF-1]